MARKKKTKAIKDGSDLIGTVDIVKISRGIDVIAGIMIKHGLNHLSEEEWEKIKVFKSVKKNLKNETYVAKEVSKKPFGDDKKEKDKKDKK